MFLKLKSPLSLTFKNLGLKKNKDFFEKSGSEYLKNALEGFSKTKDKSGKESQTLP